MDIFFYIQPNINSTTRPSPMLDSTVTGAKLDRHQCKMQQSAVQHATVTSARRDSHQCKTRPSPMQDATVTNVRCDRHQCKMRPSPVLEWKTNQLFTFYKQLWKMFCLQTPSRLAFCWSGRQTELNLQILIDFIINNFCVKLLISWYVIEVLHL